MVQDACICTFVLAVVKILVMFRLKMDFVFSKRKTQNELTFHLSLTRFVFFEWVETTKVIMLA